MTFSKPVFGKIHPCLCICDKGHPEASVDCFRNSKLFCLLESRRLIRHCSISKLMELNLTQSINLTVQNLIFLSTQNMSKTTPKLFTILKLKKIFCKI